MKPCLITPVGRVIEIVLLNNDDSVKIPLDEKEITVEEVCTLVAIRVGIGPLCRHLFSLKINATGEWLSQHFTLQSVTTTNVFVYRLRFKVENLRRFREIDVAAFNYYFHQVRTDVLLNNVKNLSYEREKGSILGLSVADMLRAILEEKVSLAEIEAKYKTFIPKIMLKNHWTSVHIKKLVIARLTPVVRSRVSDDPWYVKEEYLTHFHNIAPDYLVEDYTAEIDENGVVRFVTILVDPYHPDNPGIQYTYTGKNEWTHLCTIDDLCFVSIRSDATLEICRKNGIPMNYCFVAKSLMFSFVSLLDGYYRLSTKWTFNLCKDVYTPSLTRLHQIKCHGPVGGQFSYAKLQEKRDNKPGTFILRECEKSHTVYYLDVCIANASKPRTYSITVNPVSGFDFSYDKKTYPSIQAVISAYRTGFDPNLELLECIPPTETDKAQTLICSVESWANKLATVSTPEDYLLTTPSQFVNIQSLQVFPSTRRESRCGRTCHYRAMWKHNARSRVNVAVKELKSELKDKYLSEFLELVGRWSTLQSSYIVKLYGVTLTGKISMITEYLDMGPLDEYLCAKKQLIQQVDLVEAAASLAMALWQMEEAGISHGSIRCRKILVAGHDSNSFKIKLRDPGFHEYSDNDVPWIPPECYKNVARAKTITSDVWSYATTLWEIFSYGKKPPTSDRSFYWNGHRLAQPADCPNDIYKVMRECWDADIFKRKIPQAIMRDIYHVLYQVFNSRRIHSYTTVYPRAFSPEDGQSLTESGGSLRSDATNETLLAADVTTDELINVDCSIGNTTDLSISSDTGQLVLFRETGPYSTQVTRDIANMPFLSSYSQFKETIWKLGKGCEVVLQGRIGQGHYGQVFKGILERADHPPQQVAVKQLKSGSLGDFKREIEIMKKVHHPNVVTIIGRTEPGVSLVMEYVRHGSLQGYLQIHRETLQPLNLLKFAEDVAKGMEYLGRNKIVHRDLAARNILVASENLVKISDFGLSQFVDATNDDYYMLRTSREIPIKWYAPESLQRGHFSPRSDVWSYGVTLYEMFSYGEDPQLEGNPDEQGPPGQYAALKNSIRLPCPPGEGSQDVYRDLMMPCWKFESKERITFTAIVAAIEVLRINTFHCEVKNYSNCDQFMSTTTVGPVKVADLTTYHTD